MSKRVAVLMGGRSVEREVSLVSGADCAKALSQKGYDVVPIHVGHDLEDLLRALDPRPDVVFNALHGRFGEDGRIQGLLDLLGLPYTHSGLLSSALAMDKPLAKQIFAGVGLRCPEGKVLAIETLLQGDPFPRPYVVKPAAEGSSVGVRIVRNGDNLPPLDSEHWPFGPEVLVERYIPGRELTVAVMGGPLPHPALASASRWPAEASVALGVTELRPKVGFYDYEAKYTEGKTEHLIPAPVPEIVAEAAKNMAVTAHEVLGCRGVTRADFRFDDSAPGIEGLYLLEINTQPGMTPLSLVPEQAAFRGISFPDLVAWMVENAQCDG
jgi:D-alanine-D-alanine ligase